MMVDHYTVKDGLPGKWITTIYQDLFGYIWLGSDEGISKYDGGAFYNYGLAEGRPVSSSGFKAQVLPFKKTAARKQKILFY